MSCQKDKSEVEVSWRWLREAPELLPPVHHVLFLARTGLIFFIVVFYGAVLCDGNSFDYTEMF